MLSSTLKSLRVVTEPVRLRILLLLERDELSVAELQEILAMGQSKISTHLAQLRQAGLVDARRAGKNIFYRSRLEEGANLNGLADILPALRRSAAAMPEAQRDRDALDLVLRRRQDKVRAYFDELAGRFGREYVPGRSWQAVAEMLLKLLPPLIVGDLGAGEGTLSLLLAQRAERVIAVDSSEQMVRYGSEVAAARGVKNLEYRLGDLESLPISDAALDLARVQPVAASRAASRARRGGSVSRTQAGRASGYPRSETASVRAGARTLCGPLAGLHRARPATASERRGVHGHRDDVHQP